MVQVIKLVEVFIMPFRNMDGVILNILYWNREIGRQKLLLKKKITILIYMMLKTQKKGIILMMVIINLSRQKQMKRQLNG